MAEPRASGSNARFTWLIGAAVATLMSGPIFVATLAAGWTVQHLAQGDTDRIALAMLLITLPIAIGLGVIVSAVPMLVGGWAMHRAARHAPRLRHPLAWALAGALCATLPALALDLTGDPATLVTSMFTGAACALIVRYFARWSDASV